MNEDYELASEHDPDFGEKHPYTKCWGDGSPRGYCRCERKKEDPLHLEKCELCSYEQVQLLVHNGRRICNQCYEGEVNNPEHALPEKETSK